MSRRDLLALFVCSLVAWTVGNGALPLLPVYAAQLGAAPAVAGYYLSLSYVALAAGTVVAGWLSGKVHRLKSLLFVAGLTGIPAIWLMGRATSIPQLAIWTALAWFTGGMGLALISVLAGLLAGEDERGRVFGILSLTGALGLLIGGLATGPTAERWGYPTMFALLSALFILWPLAVLVMEEKRPAQTALEEGLAGEEGPGLGRSFILLFLASVLAAVGNFVIMLGRSLAMNALGFGATAISSTAALGGAVALPLSPIFGWLSDRAGRKRPLAICYLAASAGLLVLAMSTTLWGFWLAASLPSISSIGLAVGSAWVVDLVPQGALRKGIALLNATSWIGGIIGLGGTGHAVETLGMMPTLILAAGLPLIAIVLLIPVSEAGSQKGSARQSGTGIG
jgi:MFS family permease